MFSIRAALAYGWRTTWAQPWQVWLLWGGYAALAELIGLASEQVPFDAFPAWLGAQSLGGLVTSVLLLGFMANALAVRAGRATSWREGFTAMPHALVACQTAVLLSLLMVPAIMLIVPALVLMSTYGLVVYTALDEGGSIRTVVARTAALSAGSRYTIFWFLAVLTVPYEVVGLALTHFAGAWGYVIVLPLAMLIGSVTVHACSDAHMRLKQRAVLAAPASA